MDSALTKKERQEEKRREKMSSSLGGNSGNSAKWIIIVVASLIFLAFFGFIIYSIKQAKNKPVELSSAGWVKGSESAKVKLTEFGDLQCPACKVYEPIVRKLMKDYDGKISLTFKHFPLTSAHPNALLAARAAEAAGAQDKFWQMHDWLYDNQEAWSPLAAGAAKEKITEGAKKLGLDMAKFNKDIDSDELESKIIAEQSEGIDLGVSATPTFYLNNKKLDPTPSTYEDFKKLIDQQLAK